MWGSVEGRDFVREPSDDSVELTATRTFKSMITKLFVNTGGMK